MRKQIQNFVESALFSICNFLFECNLLVSEILYQYFIIITHQVYNNKIWLLVSLAPVYSVEVVLFYGLVWFHMLLIHWAFCS